MLSMLFKVGADATGAERAMAAAAKKGEAAFKSMGEQVTGYLTKAFAVTAIYQAIRGVVSMVHDFVDETKDLSDQMGLTTDEVQRLAIAADRAALGMGGVQTALRKIDDLRAAAASGDKKATSLFAALGIDPSQGTTLDILLKAVEASSRGAKEQAALFDMVGKKASNLRLMVKELNDLGPVKIVDETSLQMVDDLTNQLKDLKNEARASATEGLAPIFGMFARVLKRGRQIEAEGKSFALSRAILEESYGGREVPMDMSALPLPAKKASVGISEDAAKVAAPAAIPLALQSDALSRIGLFVGGRGDMGSQLVTIGNYQLSELRAIRSELQHANR
jgi:hypothetical protein